MAECLTPAKIAESMVAVGEKKVKLSILQMVILGIFAGVYIGFGAQLFTVVTVELAKFMGFGMARFLGGAVFSTGLMMVVVGGAELWTGNNLITVALMHKKAGWAGLLRNWFWVYFANFAGSLILAFIVFWGAQYKLGGYGVGVNALNIAIAKVNLSWLEAFARGILCNWLVCLAVWMAVSSAETIGKLFAIFFPIMAFVTSGFEHSIANMYFIPIGMLIKNIPEVVQAAGNPNLTNLNMYGLIIKNLIPVTIGNLVGGAIFVGVLYWVAYLKPQLEKK